MKIRKYANLGIAALLASAILAMPGSSAASSRGPEPAASGAAVRAMGSAPLMKFKILNQSAQETTYAVILGAGDEILGGLTRFAEENQVVAARITGIGAIHNGTLAWLNPNGKKYRTIPIDQQAEVLSLLGDIAMYQGKPVVHAHMVVGFSDGTTHGGHLLQAHVWPTLEVIVTSYPRPLYKKFDPQKGIAVIDPSIQQ